MKRVTGLGGVFFKSDDTTALREWYKRHLDIDENCFQWGPATAAAPDGMTVWSPFKADTTYFAPSPHPYMFNYRVADLVALIAVLREEGVTVVGEIQEFEYGKFGWILDPEGRKIELWEPVDGKF